MDLISSFQNDTPVKIQLRTVDYLKTVRRTSFLPYDPFPSPFSYLDSSSREVSRRLSNFTNLVPKNVPTSHFITHLVFSFYLVTTNLTDSPVVLDCETFNKMKRWIKDLPLESCLPLLYLLLKISYR